jgi:hypothetical protein
MPFLRTALSSESDKVAEAGVKLKYGPAPDFPSSRQAWKEKPNMNNIFTL